MKTILLATGNVEIDETRHLPKGHCPCYSGEEPHCTYWNSFCMMDNTDNVVECNFRLQHEQGVSYDEWRRVIHKKLRRA
jgi:hypothetical protein